MGLVAIIGGSGFDTYDSLVVNDAIIRETPYGNHSGPILMGRLGNSRCVFLPRHGAGHKTPPHQVNYRANLWMLKELGVTDVIACNVVGGITSHMSPDTIVIPDQLIDYTYGRENTFYDGMQSHLLGKNFENLSHIDFTSPYSEPLRQKIIKFFEASQLDCVPRGVYACTQGPRLESIAEIERLKRDGCNIVGMTGMPEVGLAREIGIEYVCVALVVNWAAGVATETLSMVDIMHTVRKNMGEIKSLMPKLIAYL
ncbi:MAG: 5'-methylthioinosine phosphorylase [Cellvibrionaceae bacterium]|jgi:5'-methylthioinosine phosphorylase